MKIQAALFKNLRKNSDRQPDYIGKGEIRNDNNSDTGIKVELAGWAQTARGSGKDYLSLIIKWENDDMTIVKADTPQPEEPKEEEPAENPLKGKNNDRPF